MMRPEEVQGGLPGAFFFLLSTLISLVVFEEPVCRLAVLNLSFGDPVASIVGQSFGATRKGEDKILALLAPGKTPHGALACFCVVCLLGCAWSVAVLGAEAQASSNVSRYILVALVSGASSAFALRIAFIPAGYLTRAPQRPVDARHFRPRIGRRS